MSIRAARYARLAAAVHTVPLVTWAVPIPAHPVRRMTRANHRKGSTKYWRDLIILSVVGEDSIGAGAVLRRNLALGNKTREGTDGDLGNIYTANWAAHMHGRVGGYGQRTSSTSNIIGGSGSELARSLNMDSATLHAMLTRGMTFVRCMVSGGAGGGMQILQGGGWNSASGYTAYAAGNAGYQTTQQNGTGSRGFGDVASTQTGGVTTLAAGELMLGFHQFSPAGHLVAAGARWDSAGQAWKSETDVSGTFSPDTTSPPFTDSWGNTTEGDVFLAVWLGCPISWREFLRDIVHRRNPLEIFYG